MRTIPNPWRSALRLLAVWSLLSTAHAAVNGTFIQLNRGKAERTVQEWRTDFRHLKQLGGTTVIVQWTAEEPVLYLGSATNGWEDMREAYPVVERILDAAEKEGLSVILGLQHHPEYWAQVKGREKVIRDFFRLRLARNARLQGALLAAFGSRPGWTGYYLPDEIDDLTWRTPAMRQHLHTYLKDMTAILKKNDPGRTVSVSAFFRCRTEPGLLAGNFRAITVGTSLDHLLLQDGTGVGDPPIEHLGFYYESFGRTWAAADKTPGSDLPALWCVIETFRQTSKPDEPFAATTAPANRLTKQVEMARPFFPHLILFTLEEYVHPDRGPAAKAGYDALRTAK